MSTNPSNVTSQTEKQIQNKCKASRKEIIHIREDISEIEANKVISKIIKNIC